MDDSKIRLLQNMPVFGGLKPETLRFLLESSESENRLASEFFFRQGQRGDCLFVLESGSVAIEKHWQGDDVEVGRLDCGDCFGEMALIDLQGRSASVRALEDCQAIKISRTGLAALFQQDAEQYAIIMMNMGREVSRRLRLLHEKLFILKQQNRMTPAMFENLEMAEVILMSSAFG